MIETGNLWKCRDCEKTFSNIPTMQSHFTETGHKAFLWNVPEMPTKAQERAH